jgi:hypothetical protein
MTTQTPLDRVLILIVKAAEAEKADDAMKFSQAACNVANALCALASAKQNPIEYYRHDGKHKIRINPETGDVGIGS